MDVYLWMYNILCLLSCYDPLMPIIVVWDASGKGLGAVICYRFSDPCIRPVCFAFRVLQKYGEEGHCAIDMEELGSFWL